MGNDGGVIAVQRRFMRHGNTKKDEEKADKSEVLLKKVSTCSLTDEPLTDPIVACELGNLFNKEALIRRLLDKPLPEAFEHIRSLKDTIPCRFTPVPAGAGDPKESSDTRARYVCPISLAEFNGRIPFVILRPCGCVMSEKALKELNVNHCPVCNVAFQGEDRIKLVPSDIEIPVILDALKVRRERVKSEKKKAKKLSKSGSSQLALLGQEPSKEVIGEEQKIKSAKRHAEEDTRPKKKQVLSAKVDRVVDRAAQEASEAIKKSKETSKVYASLFTNKEKKKEDANALLMTVGGLRYTLH